MVTLLGRGRMYARKQVSNSPIKGHMPLRTASFKMIYFIHWNDGRGPERTKAWSLSFIPFSPRGVPSKGGFMRTSAWVSPNQPTGLGAHSLLHRTSRPGSCRMREVLGWSSQWSQVCWQLEWQTRLALCYLHRESGWEVRRGWTLDPNPYQQEPDKPHSTDYQ